jgi:NAD(P)-dependent dehydrogenase (short-subunit alcohol dehydrogenase family)
VILVGLESLSAGAPPPSALCSLQVLFTAELNRRLAAAGGSVQALALHPGNVLTNVVQSLPPAIQSLYRAIMVRVLLTPEQGAAAALLE